MLIKNILAISGSTRAASVNNTILQTIKATYSDVLNITIYDGINQLPHFNPDLLGDLPSSVSEFYAKIAEADGLIICSPEYVFSIPGVLKNAIEWTVSTTLFTDKPLALIVASSLGEKTFESLTLVLETVGARMTDDTKLLISGSNSTINPETNELKEEVTTVLNKLMQAFITLLNE